MRGLLTLLFLAHLALLMPASRAAAGAWPLPKGKHFISTAVRLHSGTVYDWTSSLTYFHEYGLTDRLTIGADVGGAISGFDKAILFASYPVAERLGFKLAGQMGAGTVAGRPVIRPGFAIGRGLTDPSGWIVAEGAVEFYAEDLTYDWKLDLTAGINHSETRRYYVQLQTGKTWLDQPFSRLAGSVAFRLRPGLDLDLGGSVALGNSEPYRLKIGIWRHF